MLKNLSPEEKKWLAIGAPIVAVFALISVLQKRSAPAAEAPAAPQVAYLPPSTPTTDAIGVGQLASFESMLTNAVSRVGVGVQQTSATVSDLSDVVATQNEQITKLTNPPAKPPLPDVRSWDYPIVAYPSQQMIVLGSITGGQYSGQNVGGGAPVYAYVDGAWRQNWGAVSDGTPLATPSNFSEYVY